MRGGGGGAHGDMHTTQFSVNPSWQVLGPPNRAVKLGPGGGVEFSGVTFHMLFLSCSIILVLFMCVHLTLIS